MIPARQTYTVREYKRNAHIFQIIKVIIVITYLYITYLLFQSLRNTHLSPLGLLIVSIIFLIALVSIRRMEALNRKDIRRNRQTWGVGSAAESTVEKSLSNLPTEFTVIGDYYTGHGNIDFIVVGPTGVFVIEVKASKGLVSFQQGRLLLNDKLPEKDYLAQTEAEQRWLAQLLFEGLNKRYPVIGILEFPYARIDRSSIRGPVGHNIWVGEGDFHAYLVKNTKSYLDGSEIRDIVRLLTRSENKG